MQGLKAGRCDFLDQNRLGVGTVRNRTLHPCLSSYTIVTGKRKTLQIARICRYEAHKIKNTPGKANVRLFRDFSGYFETFGNSHTFPI